MMLPQSLYKCKIKKFLKLRNYEVFNALPNFAFAVSLCLLHALYFYAKGVLLGEFSLAFSSSVHILLKPATYYCQCYPFFHASTY